MSSNGRVDHEFAPVFDKNSKVLVLGTIPSPKSRELGFYYMHPQNRFWKIICEVLGENIPPDIDGRRGLCLKHKIALWDVLESCEIRGAEDSSIANAVPNKLDRIIGECNIGKIFTTGKKAHALYQKFFGDRENFPGELCLPSTSPANRTITESEMLREYRKIAEFLK